jgi:hypothetical protein
MMGDFVQLYWKRNRGWPVPQDSWGLGPMFGDDGWCRSCGTPIREQCGSLMLSRRGLLPLAGAWVPNWRFDAVCMEGSLAENVVVKRFAVDLREVAWKGSAPGSAFQIVAPSVGPAWFDPEQLRVRAEDRHGVAGAKCTACGTWRWMPMTYGLLPPVSPEVMSSPLDVIASPEWFGDGCQSFRQLLVRRELAQSIASASPKDFKVVSMT